MSLSDETEDLIEWSSKYFRKEQISLAPIRARQDVVLCNDIVSKSDKELARTGLAQLSGNNMFVGSVDFMVDRSENENKYFVLETNGGSSRGFAVMDDHHWAEAYDGYCSAIDVATTRLIVIGYPDQDLLLYEKILLSEHMARYYRSHGIDCRVVDIEKFRTEADASLKDAKKEDPSSSAVIVHGSYSELLTDLVLKGSDVLLLKLKVDLIIGDGLVRRHTALSSSYMQYPFKPTVTIVNPVFHVTDDKSVTYHATAAASHVLDQYNVKSIKFWRAFNEGQFKSYAEEALNEFSEIVIKPHGGSGGSGIDLITDKNKIGDHLKTSIEAYHRKFGQNRNPYPYTICQRINATPAHWRGSERQYDVRVYVARKGDVLRPLGALIRIALEPFTGEFTKKSFVVNLSGYGGVDTDRGLGISEETFNITGLNSDDMVKMFSASATLMAYIGNNYPAIVAEIL